MTVGTQHVAVNVAEAVFDGISAGVRHVMIIAVRNVSHRGQRVRILPPRSTAFKLLVQNDVDLAPGLEMQAELAYFSEEPGDVEDQLTVLVGRAAGKAEELVIPVRALLPGARLSFDSPLDFGTVVHGDCVSRQLMLRNTGQFSGRASFGPLAANSKFTIFPAEAEVAPGGEISFKVELNSSEMGAAHLKVPVTISGAQGDMPKATGVILRANVVAQSLELRDLHGKALSNFAFGKVYFGLQRSQRFAVHNTGPKPINFGVSRVALAEDGLPVAGVDDYRERAHQPISIFPAMGLVPAYGMVEVDMRMAPEKRPAAQTGFIVGGDREDLCEEFSSTQQFEVLESGQKVTLKLCGEALVPRVALSQGAFEFGDCVQVRE